MNKSKYIPALLVMLAGLAYFGFFIDYGINFEDEGTLLYQIERTADGQIPYLDFHIGYTPAIYHVHALMMRLFGYSVIPGRWLLALVNTASLGLLYLVARRLAGGWIAWIAPLLYMISIPVHRGAFATFNIPYPVWYNAMVFTASIAAMLAFADRGRLVWIALAGALAGVNFAFKPNAGLLNLAALGLCITAIVPAVRPDVSKRQRRFELAWWWLFWIATTAGVMLIFAARGSGKELTIFVAPMILAALAAGWRSMVSAPAPTQPDIIRSTLALGLSFFAIVVPWIGPIWQQLGTERFLADVLYIGASFEQFYYIPYPPVQTMVVVALGLSAAAYFTPRLVRLMRIRMDYLAVSGVIAGCASLTYVASHAAMPDGFSGAIWSEYQAAVFGLSVFAQWSGLFFLARSIGISEKHRSLSANYTIVAIGALLMFMQVYPRTDYTHWVTAAPLTLCLVASLLNHLGEHWCSGLPANGQRLLKLACVIPIIGFVGLRLYANTQARVSIGEQGPVRIAEYQVHNPRVPVRINLGRAIDYDAAERVAALLSRLTQPQEKVFTFPMLDLISFMSDRHNPTRHGYFYPGWPGHDWESEVVADLRAAPPRFAVVLHDHAPFFVQASLYYYAIADFLEEDYRPYTQIGHYTLMAHRRLVEPSEIIVDKPHMDSYLDDAGLLGEIELGLSSPDPALRLKTLQSIEPLMLEEATPRILDALGDADPRVRDSAVNTLRYARDADTTTALAKVAAAATTSPRERTIAIRAVSSSGRERAAGDLLELIMNESGALADEATSALFHTTNRALAASFWIGVEPDDPAQFAELLPDRRRIKNAIINMIEKPDPDFRMRLAAIWLSRGLPSSVAIPLLTKIFREGESGMAVRAGVQLLQRGVREGIAARAIELMVDDNMLAPWLVNAADADGATKELANTISKGPVWQRRSAAWVAANVGGNKLTRALAGALASEDREIRQAAIWGLYRSCDREFIAPLRELTDDSDYTIRILASRAVTGLQSGCQ